MEYAAYRDKHFSLSCEERKGRAMNMQEFIWSKIPRSSGPYQYDSDDPRDMKMKDIFERHKLSCMQFQEENEKEIKTENNLETTDEFSTTSSNKSFYESDPQNPEYNSSEYFDELSTTSSEDSNSNNVIPKLLNSHPECVIAPSPSPSYITHYPDWYFDIIGNNVHDKVLKKVLVGKDWITESLREEIMALSPKRSDITVDNLTQDFSVDPEQFKKCCMNFFPLHRTFVNYKQLYAAADLLFKQWKICMKATSKSIRCNYSHTPHMNKYKQICPPNKKRKVRVNVNEHIQCPFCIKWSLVEHKRPHKDDIFYKVRISSIQSLEHTCLMSESSYRTALSSRAGHVKINLDVMTTTVQMLKANPNLPARQLRQLLKSALTTVTVLDSKFLNNFRIKVANFHANHQNSTVITMEDSIKLASTNKLSIEDSISFHDPMIRANFNEMFRNIMKEDPSTWTAIQFL